jgi:methyltransferase (TIGR00027 family)
MGRSIYKAMEDARPSRTAMRVAMRRAAHQLFDAPPLVLNDPVAVRIIDPEAAAKMKASPSQQQGGIARSARAFMVARSRFAEDALARAVARGTGQFVILGAGLDTFAYRNPYPEGTLRVFEVDHPATQAWKRRKLATASIAVPASVTYVPVDFERDSLADRLAAAGFDASRPAFFSWLGVTMYLSEDAFASTLSLVARSGAGGGVAFDYGTAPSRLAWTDRIVLAWISRLVASAGEPFRSLFEPDALVARLRQQGFASIEDLGVDAINARYFAGRPDRLRIRSGVGRLMSGDLQDGRY